MSAPIDKDVREEIRTNLGASICVEAGAGTGKTTSLVSRLVELLATGAASADSLVVITFTEAAAAELSARVREAIGAAAAAEPDAERRARLVRARKELYRAHIETIHAFASALLRERPVEGGLDPEFEVLSGLEKDLDFDSVYDEWLDRMLAGEDPAVGRALNLGLGLGDIRKLAETVDKYRFLLPLERFPEPDADLDRFVRWVETTVEDLRGLEASCTDEGDQAFLNLRAACELLDELRDAGGEAAQERYLLHARYHAKQRTRAGAAKRWGGDGECLARVRELAIELGDRLKAFQGALHTAALLGVLPRAEEFVAEYRERRRREGRPDFDDLLIWARDLLRNRLEVRRYFQRRFSHILIDEFQDTDPIQVEIAMYLASDGQDGTNWRDLEPTPGKLFVVGDPKQSIYRFRRADIAIYDEVKRRVMSEDLLRIRQNFRSLEGIIDWVNHAFDRLFDEEEGVQPANDPLASTGETLPEGGEAPSVVVLHGAADERANAESLRRDEAAALAALLQDAVERDPWQVRDPETKAWRPARWGDVAILMHTRSGLRAFEEALGGAGIPHRHAGARDYFRRQEVRDLIHILRAIDDPGDGFSVVGALRSSAFGCSDADLVTHRAGDGTRRGNWNYNSRAESPSAQVEAAFEVLRDLNRARRGLSLAELVRRAIEQSNLVEFALTLPDGPQAAANLLAIGEQAQGFAAAGGGGLRAFTRWLARNVETESDEVDASVSEDADDVVHLMTIHGAKGLEFPIVILGNLESKGKNGIGAVVDEPHTLHMRLGTKDRGYFPTPGYGDRCSVEQHAHEAEQIRLLYVAATRARDHLVVPCFRGNGVTGGSPLALLDDLLPVDPPHREVVEGALQLRAEDLEPAVQVEEREERAGDEEIEEALTDRETWKGENDAIRRRAHKELPLQVASSIERSTRPMTSEASSSSAALLLSEGPPIPIGDALHLVMEKVSLPDAEDLDEIVEAVCADGGLEEFEDEVQELAGRCLDSPTVRRAIELGTYQREVPFTIPMADGGFLTGRIDLLFREGDAYVIVDYKTDTIAAEAVADHTCHTHSGQLAGYLSAIPAGAPSSVALVYARPGIELVAGG